jgi:hypothetical protein
MTGHKNFLQAHYNNGQILCSQLNKITSVLQMSVTNQQQRIKKIFPLTLKIKAVCIWFANIVILNTVSSQVCIAMWITCFEIWAPWFFRSTRHTYLSFNMNDRRGTLFNFGVKKSHDECVCHATNSDWSTPSLQNDLQCIQKGGKTTSTQKKKPVFSHKYMDSYLEFVFVQCPETHQLSWPQCIVCATRLGYESVKPLGLTRYLNTQQTKWITFEVKLPSACSFIVDGLAARRRQLNLKSYWTIQCSRMLKYNIINQLNSWTYKRRT